MAVEDVFGTLMIVSRCSIDWTVCPVVYMNRCCFALLMMTLHSRPCVSLRVKNRIYLSFSTVARVSPASVGTSLNLSPSGLDGPVA